jgi:hypothetical protein
MSKSTNLPPPSSHAQSPSISNFRTLDRLHDLPMETLRPKRLRLRSRLFNLAHPIHHRRTSRPRVLPLVPQWPDYRCVRGYACRSAFLGLNSRYYGPQDCIQHEFGYLQRFCDLRGGGAELGGFGVVCVFECFWGWRESCFGYCCVFGVFAEL